MSKRQVCYTNMDAFKNKPRISGDTTLGGYARVDCHLQLWIRSQ